MIVPVIPPQSPLQELIHGPVAASPLVRTANPQIVYGIRILGESGRVLVRRIYQALAWEPGTRLSLAHPATTRVERDQDRRRAVSESIDHQPDTETRGILRYARRH